MIDPVHGNVEHDRRGNTLSSYKREIWLSLSTQPDGQFGLAVAVAVAKLLTQRGVFNENSQN